MRDKERLKRLAFWGIIMGSLGTSVFSNHPLIGQVVCMAGLALLLVIKVILWKNKERIP